MTAHTALHAPQANAQANRNGDTSPFSALLESTAPKTGKADKPKDRNASDDDAGNDKADAAQADAAKTGGKPDTARADAPETDKSDKSEKPDKDTAKAADADATDAAQLATDAPAQPVTPPTPTPVAIAAVADTAKTDGGIETLSDTANAAAAPLQNTGPGKTDTADNAAPQDDNRADDVAAAAPQDVKSAPAPRQPVTDDKSGKPDAVKTGSAKTESAKPDTAKAESAKPDTAKPDAPQPVAAGDAPAPKPVQAADTNMAVHDITAPQAPAAPNAPNAPSVTQHVQVAQQQPQVPNLPALAIEISAKSQSGARQFDIRLDPPELGRVEVRLSIDAAGKASAHLSADQPQTLDLLQKDSTSLMRALRDAGLDVSQDGLNFSLRQQAQNHQDGGAHQSSGRPRNFGLTAATSLQATATSAAYRGPADGRVDISV